MLLQQRKDIKSEANSKSRNKPRRIIRDANSELPKEVLAQLPTQEASRQVINRIKRKQVDGGVNPITRAEIMIPTDLKFTLNGERFLFEDTDDDDRIIIFTTFENLRILKRNLDWLCDGTFDIAPQTHTQLFTIHPIFKEKDLPLVYALLPSKEKSVYERFFYYFEIMWT